MVWKSLTCSTPITTRVNFQGLLVVVNDVVVVCNSEDETQVRAILASHGISVVNEATFNPPPPPTPRESIEVDASVIREIGRGEESAGVPVWEVGKEEPVEFIDAPQIPMVVSHDNIPVIVDVIEEKIQTQFSLAKADSTSIIDELFDLIRVSDISYYKSLREKIFDLGRRVKLAENEMLTLAMKKMTQDALKETMSHFLDVELPERVKRFCESRLPSLNEVDEVIDKVKTDTMKRVLGSENERAKLDKAIAEAVTWHVEREEAFGELQNIGNVKNKVKKRLYEELKKISDYPFVETMWCTSTSFVVQVNGARIFDSAHRNKEYYLGRYNIEIIFNQRNSGILKIIHTSTPHADYMHPHISMAGSNVCFGSGQVREGLIKMLSEFDVALAVQVLFSFLNMYNPNSPYIKPDDLYEHWQSRHKWSVKKEKEGK